MSLELPSGVHGTLMTPAPAERRRDHVVEAKNVGGRSLVPVRFADADARERTCRDAALARSIVLRPRADAPGTLASCIDGDFESALALRGAVPPLVHESASLEERLADQLARATALPVKGVCLALPPLGACIESDGILADADARYLGAWWRSAAARVLPITMIFDEQDRALTARVPRSLETVLADLFIADSFANERGHAARFEHLEVDVEPEPATSPEPASVAPCETTIEAAVVEAIAPPTPEPTATDALAETEVVATRAVEAEVADTEHAPRVETAEAHVHGPAPEQARRARSGRGASLPLGVARAMKDTLRVETVVEADPTAQPAPRRTRRPEPEGPNLAELHHHTMELDAARGPKPVAAIERLYAQHYVPLLGHVVGERPDPSVKAVADTWSQAFQESYVEGFSALRVTPRRPTMVFDSFDVAARIARVASARSVKALLVDSMSFDLGERVAARMRILLDRRAVLVERTTLWSALPTNTPTQMSLLARGAEGLKETPPASEPDITRGRNIGTLRRERIGSRELMKLDLVEARLRTPGASYDERLDGIADEVSDVVSGYLESLPPRTLLFVFGDHGFVLGHGANGWATGPAVQGGASPEEVLVSGHAWLADSMH